MKISRRKLLVAAGVGGAGISLTWTMGGLHRLFADGTGHRTLGFGPLVKDPDGLLDLPAGFSYVAFSRTGEPMDDGLRVPAAHDGMAAFAGDDGNTILVRNHELTVKNGGAFADPNMLGPLKDRVYDAGGTAGACLGGTTTLVYDTKGGRLVRQHLSLGGTVRNCAGGATPWESWVTCEEAPLTAASSPEVSKDHGYCFEVPSKATGLVDPVPLVAMGRFNHEAVAVHAKSGVVYQTEDRGDSLFYRYVPAKPGDLAAGGRLEALAVAKRPALDTSNHKGATVVPGAALPVAWVPIDAPESPGDDLRQQGVEKGAAVFVRGEGLIAGADEVFFVCTSGGAARRGQVWRYRPSPHEGTPEEATQPGTLSLFVEPNDASILDNPDNITIAPSGDLILTEDGGGRDRVVGVTPQGGLYVVASNALNGSELAGPTFSPDGTTLFVNIQSPGITLAITGPWSSRHP